MESRYAQERVGSSCRARFGSTAANRVRGIVGIVDLEHLEFDRDYDRPGHARRAQASSTALPPKGSVVLVVQKSAVGYVLAEANGQVVYIYDKDTKGGSPTCTGSCAAIWPPLTGNPVASPADYRPGHTRHGLGRERR